jgi:hypothetical protein
MMRIDPRKGLFKVSAMKNFFMGNIPCPKISKGILHANEEVE